MDPSEKDDREFEHIGGMLFSHLVEYTVALDERPRQQHIQIEGTVQSVGVEMDDALKIAEH